MRVILHSDLNNFYASVEMLYHPNLRGRPIAVTGDQDKRHGIVLAKNYEAKKHGIATGETVFSALAKCPDLQVVEANFHRYMLYSSLVKKIYMEYTSQLESFSIDEAWLDVTKATAGKLENGVEIADAIRTQIKNELGLTVSIGVSYNKIYAKLGSDIKKPDATTLITEENKYTVVYPLPVCQLLMVGPKTGKKLESYSIATIGDLAKTPVKDMEKWLGKNGTMLVEYACGQCHSPVTIAENMPLIKSVGNGNTAPRDLHSKQDINALLTVLSESVAQRLRKHCLAAYTLSLTIKDSGLDVINRQETSETPMYTENQIRKMATALFEKYYTSDKGVRALTITCANLTTRTNMQCSLFCDTESLNRCEIAENAVIQIRNRYGYEAIQKGGAFVSPDISIINPYEDNTIHPLNYRR